jgi:O-antigen ligase
MLAILIATPFSIADPKRLRSRLYFLALPVISVALVFTYVRAAWLGLGLGLLYLAFHRYKVMVYGIPLALVAFLFLPGGTSFTQAAFQSESFNARTTSWSQKYHVLLDNPLGTGIGTTGAAAATSVKLRGVNQATFQPDNAYLKVAFELGVLGLWLFVLLLVAAFREGRSVERRVGDPERHFAAGWCAQVLAIAAAATVSTYFEMIPMDALFWITLGIVSTMAPIELPTRTVGQLEGSERAAFASTAS